VQTKEEIAMIRLLGKKSVAVASVFALGLGVYGTVATLASQRHDVLSFGGDRLVMQASPLAVDGNDVLRAKESTEWAKAQDDALRAKESDWAKGDDDALRAKEYDGNDGF
jgi:hypothetical protein